MSSVNNRSKKGGRVLPFCKPPIWPTLKNMSPSIISFADFYNKFKNGEDIMDSFNNLHQDKQYAILFYMIASSCTPQPLTKLKDVSNLENITDVIDSKIINDYFNNKIVPNIITNLKTETIKYLLSKTPEAPEVLQKLQQNHYDTASKDQIAKFEKYTNYDLLDLSVAITDLFPSLPVEPVKLIKPVEYPTFWE
jgi:glycosylphosphatidylinositol transamidase (GPIT) subunit GPI8